MADHTFADAGSSPRAESAAHGFEKAATSQSLSDQAMSAGRELKNKAVELAGSSSETINDHAAHFAAAAKDVASQTTAKIKQTVDGQKAVGADYVGDLADTIRRAAKEFDSDLPMAGTYIRKAAAQVDGVSETLRSGNLNDLVRNAQSFARRQPTAFLGIAVLAGFGVVRFLKSSADKSASIETRQDAAGRPGNDTNGIPRSDSRRY